MSKQPGRQTNLFFYLNPSDSRIDYLEILLRKMTHCLFCSTRIERKSAVLLPFHQMNKQDIIELLQNRDIKLGSICCECAADKKLTVGFAPIIGGDPKTNTELVIEHAKSTISDLYKKFRNE